MASQAINEQTYMSIKQIRMEMGLTQEELAGYLDLHRTQLVHAENGNRDLPHKCTGKWTRMKHCLDDPEQLEAAVAAMRQEQEVAQVAPMLAKLAKNCNRNIYVLQHKLQRMQDNYATCLRTMAFIAELRQLPQAVAGLAIWVNKVEGRVRKTCLACGPGRQAIVSLKLQALLHMQEQLASQYGIIEP